jgi:hypothetical protein
MGFPAALANAWRGRWLLPLIVVVALTGCGSSGKSTTAVPGGAPVRTPGSAPAYCQALVSAKSLVDLSTALNALARDPRDPSAHTTISAAATAVNNAAAQAPGPERTALRQAASALRSLAAHGLASAGGLENAFADAGRGLERSCSFPIR